jgi:hypothetical protein
LRQATGHPVLLAKDGKIVGVCSENEIIGAMNQSLGNDAEEAYFNWDCRVIREGRSTTQDCVEKVVKVPRNSLLI